MARPPPPPPSAGRSADLSDLNKVWEVRALKRRPREAEARQLLLRIAAQVQPIMKRRGWQVPLLREFFPSNASLLGLNINGGREIRIRLRHARNDGASFLPYEDLLGTMLHELTHIVRGPHDARFYALLDELKEECEELMARGITGPLEDSAAAAGPAGSGAKAPAYVGQGRRLGGFTRLPPPPQSEQRRAAAAAAAAERRQQTSRVMPRGPRKLGGDSGLMHALSPVQAAAMAAERRIRDDVWCGGAAGAGGSGMNDGIEEEEEVVVLGASSGPGSEVLQRDRGEQGVHSGKRQWGQQQRQQLPPQQQKQQEQPRKRPGDSTSLAEPFSGLRLAPPLRLSVLAATAHEATGAAVRHGALAPSAHAAVGHPSPSDETTMDVGSGRRWECVACTLLNEAIASECQVCGAPRVTASSSGSPTVAAAGEAAVKARAGPHMGSHSSSSSSSTTSRNRKDPSDAHKGIGGGGAAWRCSRCTLDNAAPARVCAACDAPCAGGGHPLPPPPATDAAQQPASTQSRRRPGPTAVPQLVSDGAACAVQGPSVGMSGISGATRTGGACARGESARSSAAGASAREGNEPRLWTCRQCTLHNSVADARCAACDSWRYSYGPPVAHGPLHRGT